MDTYNRLANSYFNNPYSSIVDDSLVTYREKVEILSIITENSSVLISSKSEISIPSSIFGNNSALEAIILYLKDFLKLKYSEIGVLLNMDHRTIWVTYANAKRKNVAISVNEESIFIPLKVFSNRSFSVLETLVLYLKSVHDLSFNEISRLLDKNYRTIWTVYNRMLRKMGNED